MSLIADALSLAEPEADEEEGPVDEGALDKALLSIFKAARDGLDDMLALAVGQGSGDYDNLPQFGECEPYACETAIGGFFADGRILMQGEGEDDAFSSAFSWINKKLVDIGMFSSSKRSPV